jgi:hypothetical protein
MADDAGTTTQGGDELLYRASVEDNTQQFFDKFDQNVAQTGSNATTGFNQVTTASNNSNAGLTRLAVAFGLAASVSTMFFNMIAKGVRDLEAFVSESVQAAAQYDRMGTTLDTLGKAQGYSLEQLQAYQKGLEAQNISMEGARTVLVRMLQAEMNLKDADAILKLAQDASVITNTSVATSMDRIVKSIQVLQPRYLRTMGIYVDVRKEEENYAKANNTTVVSLDEVTKRHIFLEAVLEKAKDIQGAYTASLATAAGQAQLGQQKLDNLKVTFGELAQPVYYQWLKTINELLSKLQTWLDTNQGEFRKLAAEVGGDTAIVFKGLFNLITGAANAFDHLLILMGGWGNAIAGIKEPVALKDAANDMDAFNNAITAGTQLIGMFRAGWNSLMSQMADNLVWIDMNLKLIFAGDWTDLAKLNSAASIAEFTAKRIEDANNAAKGPLEETSQLLNDANKAQKDWGDLPVVPSDAEIAALDTFNQGLQDLHDKLEEQAAQAAIQKTRDAIEAALKDAWQQEDMAQNLADDINGIEATGQEDKLKIVQDYAQKRYTIEKDYEDSLKKLRDNFEFDADEAARKRDAVALLALSRKYDKDLKDLKDNKATQQQTAKQSYDQAVKDLNKSTQDQVKKAEDAYNKQEQALATSKQRDEIIQKLHDQWAAEDLATQTAKDLKALVDSYVANDTATQDGLNQMKTDWGAYFPWLINYINSQAPLVQASLNNMMSGGTPSGSISGQRTGSNPKANASNITGQAGNVTSFLTPGGIDRPAALQAVPVSRLPSVASSGGTTRKELDVKVSGDGLNPYIQRQLVRTLAEIERNSP